MSGYASRSAVVHARRDFRAKRGGPARHRARVVLKARELSSLVLRDCSDRAANGPKRRPFLTRLRTVANVGLFAGKLYIGAAARELSANHSRRALRGPKR